MKIGIIANNYDYLMIHKYWLRRSKLNKFLKECDIIFKIPKTLDEIDNRENHIYCLKSKVAARYCDQFMQNDSALNSNRNILFSGMSFVSRKNNYNVKSNRYKKIVENIPDANIISINEDYLNQYADLFEKGSILTGHRLILHCLSNYENAEIYLLGFNHNDIFWGIKDTKRFRKKISGIHSLEKNTLLLDSLLNTHDNLFVKTSF